MRNGIYGIMTDNYKQKIKIFEIINLCIHNISSLKKFQTIFLTKMVAYNKVNVIIELSIFFTDFKIKEIIIIVLCYIGLYY